MDERERFDIRRKVLAENGMDFEDYISRQQAEINELERRNDIMVTALSEIKATNDGESSQPISDIIQWCIGEIAKHKGEVMKRISGEEIARIWNGDNDSGSEHDEAPANMIDFFPADEAQDEIDALKESIKEHDKWEKEEAIAFAVIKEEWRTQIIEKKAEIDELKKALASMASKYSDLLISNKHREK